MKVQRRLLECREIAAALRKDLQTINQGAAATPSIQALETRAKLFFTEAHQAFEDFVPVFGSLLGRKAPNRNYAALAKWAEKWFGADDALSVRLKTANAGGIRHIADVFAGIAAGKQISVTTGANPAEATWGFAGGEAASVVADLNIFDEGAVLFIEETMMAALRHVRLRAPVMFTEIPEAERDGAAPIRFRAMIEDADGKLVPAGKFTQAGNIVPELQRLLQQGRGKPIIATKYNGEWFVASGSKMYHSPKWKNFHDFLGHYIKDILKGEWANLELKKPREERHPLMVWYEDVVRYTNKHLESGKHAPMTSLPAAYLGLAYNLYLISHNNGKVHELLIRRLQHRDQFYGAYFETVVAGMMIRAGFDIELEDETDSTTSHSEFTATHRESGQKLSVEAKMRVSKKHPPEVGNQLYNALKKTAKYARLVFIEINDEVSAPEAQEILLRDILANIRSREADLTINNQPAPHAYLVVMNNPPANVDRPHAHAYMVEGFKIPDFRVESIHGNLREALDARKRHIAIFALVESLRTFNRIPVTFDGDTQAFAETNARGRLIIGNKYRIQGPDGDVTGELAQATVIPDQRAAYCILTEAGRNQMVMVPLSDQEMLAYHESPRTFFGREEREKKIEDPLKLYDWFYESYKHNTKEHLLELLTEMGAKDIEYLKSLPQEQLAEIFAERTAESIAYQSGLNRPLEKPDRTGA